LLGNNQSIYSATTTTRGKRDIHGGIEMSGERQAGTTFKDWMKKLRKKIAEYLPSPLANPVAAATIVATFVALLTLSAIFANDASACGRCGIFGRGCRFAQVHHVQQFVAPVVVDPHAVVAPYQQPQSIVVQNNYPPSNGVLPIIAQTGQTAYGLQAAFQPYRLDPDAVLRQAAELTKAAQNLADQGLKGYSNTASLALTLQASQPAIAAAVNAPQQFVAPAGQGVTQSIRLSQNVDGSWKVDVDSGNGGQYASIPGAATGQVGHGSPNAHPVPGEIPGEVPGLSPNAGIGALLKKHCASCHGKDQASPKGGLYFDQGVELDCDTHDAAVASIKSGKMPKGGTLSETDKALIRLELQDLMVGRAKPN
jgi:hypothetical protein